MFCLIPDKPDHACKSDIHVHVWGVPVSAASKETHDFPSRLILLLSQERASARTDNEAFLTNAFKNLLRN